MLHKKSSIDDIISKPDSNYIHDDTEGGMQFEKIIGQVRASILINLPFFGYVLGHFKIYATTDKRISTFGVDRYYLYFDSNYIRKMKENVGSWERDIRYQLLHLVIHLIFHHISRRNNRHAKIWTFAADVVVEQLIRSVYEDCTIPSNWQNTELYVAPDELYNLSTEQIYEKLLKLVIEESEKNSRSEMFNSFDFDDNLDQYVMDNIFGSRIPPNRERLNSTIDQVFDPEELDQILGNFTKLTPECETEQIIHDMSAEDDQSSSASVQDEMFLGVVRTALERGRDNLPGGLTKKIDEFLNPVLNWRHLLSKNIQSIVSNDYSWKHPNRRMYSQGYYLPSLDRENIDVVIAIDTSGSIDDEVLTYFLTETQSILHAIRNVRITLIDCDSKIQQVKTYQSGESLINHKFMGRGGTSFYPVFDYMKNHPAKVLIYFTDGDASFPEYANFKVIWVITNRNKVAPVGNTIYFN